MSPDPREVLKEKPRSYIRSTTNMQFMQRNCMYYYVLLNEKNTKYGVDNRTYLIVFFFFLMEKINLFFMLHNETRFFYQISETELANCRFISAYLWWR